MGNQRIEPPKEFLNLVRDALLHLYDPAYLQTHPLLAAIGQADSAVVARGQLLRRALLDAIEALKPPSGVPANSRGWRAYRILELRYIEGQEVTEVLAQIGLSKAQYHREHGRALEGVASVLWERWGGNCGLPMRLRNADLARVEAAHLRPDGHPGYISTAEVLLGVCDLLQPYCARHGVDLRLELADHLPSIHGDRVALRQALLPILTHAINTMWYRPVDIVTEYRDDYVQIRIRGVTDIPIQADELGIEISRPFIEALNGEVAFVTEPKRPGSWCVQLSFPVSARPIVLVVDNDADFIRLVERSIAEHGWQVVGVLDVDRAYQLAQQLRPRVILLDVVIPGRDGWDLLTELKTTAATRDLPVIICSVLAEPDIAISLGAVAYLDKPVDPHRLITTLSAFQ